MASGEKCFHKSGQLRFLRLSQIFFMDAPTAQLLFLLGGLVLRLCAFSWSCKACRMPRACHLFSIGQCPEVLVFVCLLSMLQSWLGILCRLARHLQRLALTVHKGMWKELDIGGGWGNGVFEINLLGHLQARHAKWLMNGFPVCSLQCG